ncbi:hypothetical protein BQ8482_380211 [Mesorhizobium delmotii]|uniref:Uncharacterized protein n=2 Tax=Mesorhizobium delmotii TaxID=1631247 RepID=A0A2P9AS90_9HYPH|nr:hypothetical protein BQ8482_380211 [Mesorhizobium delmotii]
MREQRPFYRVFTVTKQEAAVQQIEAAITAFHAGQFAVAITLTGAAEDMAPGKAVGLWENILGRRPAERKQWIACLNETFYWLKHEKPDAGPTRNLTSVEAGFFILRAMDKWDAHWTPPMLAFKELWLSSPKLMRPEDYAPEGEQADPPP